MKKVFMAENSKEMSRLVLGTAQLGMPYGIANKTGKPDFSTALSIVQTAWENGITEFDTAQAYGDSEQVLGRIFENLGIADKVKVITKLKSSKAGDGKALHQFVEESLKRMKISTLECLLLHREDTLDILDDSLMESLRTLVQRGYVRYLGISVYSPDRALQALKYDLFDVLQIPASILDRRFHRAGVFKFAEERNRHIYIRSAFLQGLVLMNEDNVPDKMASVKPALVKLEHLALEYRLSRQAIALLYLKNRFTNAKVIFGAETTEQVMQNAHYWKLEAPADLLFEVDNTFQELEENILNPATWYH